MKSSHSNCLVPVSAKPCFLCQFFNIVWLSTIPSDTFLLPARHNRARNQPAWPVTGMPVSGLNSQSIYIENFTAGLLHRHAADLDAVQIKAEEGHLPLHDSHPPQCDEGRVRGVVLPCQAQHLRNFRKRFPHNGCRPLKLIRCCYLSDFQPALHIYYRSINSPDW